MPDLRLSKARLGYEDYRWQPPPDRGMALWLASRKPKELFPARACVAERFAAATGLPVEDIIIIQAQAKGISIAQ